MIIKRKFDKIENNCLKKILYINLIIAVGLAISLYILIGKQINITQIINENLIPFTDFTDVLKLAAGKLNPNATGNYFPFTYIFMRVLEFISFGNYILLYSIIFISCILICGWFCVKILIKEMNLKRAIINTFMLIFFQFPMIFVFQRGNIEIFVLTFCILFYILFKKEKYNLAAVVLALAVSMKLYPALLAMLFISRKRYRSFFVCAGTSVLITILSWLLIQSTLGGLTHYLSGFTNFIDLYASNIFGMQHNHSILFGIYYVVYKVYGINGLFEIFNSSIVNIYTIVIICIAIPLTIYTTLKKMQEWKKVAIFILMIVSFPQISFEYTLILLVIPIMEFIGENNTKKWENITYSILFRLIINTYEYK